MNEEIKGLLSRIATLDDMGVNAVAKFIDDRKEAEMPEGDNDLVIAGWKDLMTRLNNFTEDELRQALNFEVVVYKRKAIILRLHQRYCKVRDTNERYSLMAGEPL